MTDRSTRLTAVLAAIVAVLAVVAVFVTSYRGSDDDTEETGSSEDQRVGGQPAPAGPGESEPTEEPPDEGGDPIHPPEAPDPEVIEEIQQTTVRFLRAWAEPGNEKERALAIGPYATQSLTQQLANVDPANLPTAELRDQDPEVEGGAQSTATATAEFDDGLGVRCELVLGPDGWMVSKLLPLSDEDEGADGGDEAQGGRTGRNDQNDQSGQNDGGNQDDQANGNDRNQGDGGS